MIQQQPQQQQLQQQQQQQRQRQQQQLPRLRIGYCPDSFESVTFFSKARFVLFLIT